MADNVDVEEYAKNLNNIVHSGFITLALGLGINTGLLDIVSKLNKPESISTIAELSNLNERYVKEWLGCMVAGKIVFMEDEDKYFIPEKYRECLVSARYAPLLSIIGRRDDVIESLFRNRINNGLDPYHGEFGKLSYDFLDKERMSCVDQRLDEGILPRLKQYIDEDNFKMVLDVGCASAILTVAFAKRYPDSQVIGFENCEEALKRARRHVLETAVSNTDIVNADVTMLPADWSNKFDVIFMFDILHDLPDPDLAIEELKRVLKDCGVLVVIEPKLSSSHHKNQGDFLAALYYSVSIYNCLPSSMCKPPAAALGTGWGTENTTEFFIKHGLHIQEISDFTINERSNMFILKKMSQSEVA